MVLPEHGKWTEHKSKSWRPRKYVSHRPNTEHRTPMMKRRSPFFNWIKWRVGELDVVYAFLRTSLQFLSWFLFNTCHSKYTNMLLARMTDFCVLKVKLKGKMRSVSDSGLVAVAILMNGNGIKGNINEFEVAIFRFRHKLDSIIPRTAIECDQFCIDVRGST